MLRLSSYAMSLLFGILCQIILGPDLVIMHWRAWALLTLFIASGVIQRKIGEQSC